MTEKLLSILREKEGYVSGEELGKILGVSRTAVWKNIAKLKEKGYEIEAVTNKGYRLLTVKKQIFNELEIKNRLRTKRFGKEIHFLQQVDSTNNEARRLAEAGAPEGMVVIAESQSEGKGRRGKAWTSPVGTGLWMSLILRPQILPIEAPKFTLLAGLCVEKAVRAVTGLDVQIKWPNDILINTKKVCGILTEMSAEMENVNYIVLGIGINVNVNEFTPEISQVATSLKKELGKEVDRALLAGTIINDLEEYYDRYVQNCFHGFIEEYKKHCITLGHEVNVVSQRPFTAYAADITEDGELVVEKADGSREIIFSGEVSVRLSNKEAR